MRKMPISPFHITKYAPLRALTVPRQSAFQKAGIVTFERSAQNRNGTPLVQRAYQLARSGAFAGWAEISDRLKREGYTATSVNVHLEGKAIRADLKRICDEAKRV